MVWYISSSLRAASHEVMHSRLLIGRIQGVYLYKMVNLCLCCAFDYEERKGTKVLVCEDTTTRP